jgi:hypothetical protein
LVAVPAADISNGASSSAKTHPAARSLMTMVDRKSREQSDGGTDMRAFRRPEGGRTPVTRHRSITARTHAVSGPTPS